MIINNVMSSFLADDDDDDECRDSDGEDTSKSSGKESGAGGRKGAGGSMGSGSERDAAGAAGDQKELPTRVGKICSIVGPIVDVQFEDSVPEIMNALDVPDYPGGGRLVLEVSIPFPLIFRLAESYQRLPSQVFHHLGEDTVRTVAMDSTEGLYRGQPVTDTGYPIRVPVGPSTLGRILNVIGEPIDERGPVKTDFHSFIHNESPVLTELNVNPELLQTGIKVSSVAT